MLRAVQEPADLRDMEDMRIDAGIGKCQEFPDLACMPPVTSVFPDPPISSVSATFRSIRGTTDPFCRTPATSVASPHHGLLLRAMASRVTS